VQHPARTERPRENTRTSPLRPVSATLSRIDYALLERIERGGTAVPPPDRRSGTERERFGGILDVLIFHEELGLVAVTHAGPEPSDGEGPVRAVAEGMPLAGVGRG
jgi:hypothetical protein